MTNFKSHLARLLLFTLCLWTGAYGQATPPSLAQSSQGPSLRAVSVIVAPIDETKRVVLAGNTRGEVRPEFDQGPVEDSFPLNGMQLQLRRSPEREQAAESLADELQRKGSARFHQWLTAEQYAEQFGAATEDIATISAWLSAHGFTVHAPSPSRMTIDFSGTAAQVREAFGTEIHIIDVKGERHIANVRDPSIPTALRPAIEGIVSLHDFGLAPRSCPGRNTALALTAITFGGSYRLISRRYTSSTPFSRPGLRAAGRRLP